jgi:hypothetical protein
MISDKTAVVSFAFYLSYVTQVASYEFFTAETRRRRDFSVNFMKFIDILPLIFLAPRLCGLVFFDN